MDTIQVSQLDLKEVRLAIAGVLKFRPDLVLDGNKNPNVGSLKQFCTVTPIDTRTLGHKRKFNGINEEETIIISNETTVSISFYGKDAYVLACWLSGTLLSTYSYMMFNAIRACVLSCSSVRNIPQQVSAGFEERAQFDVVISHNHVIKQKLNHINDLELKFEVNP